MIIKNCPAINICNCKETNGCLLKQIIEVNKVSLLTLQEMEKLKEADNIMYVSKWKEHNMAEQTLRLFGIEEGDI